MKLSSENFPTQRADKVKYLYLPIQNPGDQGAEYRAYFYAEAKIDFNDVRTGFRSTMGLSKALDIYSNNANLLWSDDMVADVDPLKIKSAIPDSVRLGPLPVFVDANFISRMETQFIQYLLRSFLVKIYRNADLNTYSFFEETQSEFAKRCRELFDVPMRRDIDLLRDVINRRLEQLKEKYLSANESGEMEEGAKVESQNKDIYSYYSERLAAIFLRGEFQSKLEAGPFSYSLGMQELEERLMTLEFEAQQSINKLRDSYEEKARALDEYILHPNLKDIHFVRSGILWMPPRAV
jgi:hypothetical protein